MKGFLKIAALQLLFLAALVGAGEYVFSACGVVPVLRDNSIPAGKRGKMDVGQFDPDTVETFCQRKEKALALHQIIFLGGSSMAGTPHSSEFSIPSKTQKALDSGFPGKFAAVNLGRPCKDSFYFLACAKKYGLQGVRTVVVYDGHNDLINFERVAPGILIFLARHPVLLRVMKFVQMNSRIYAATAQVADRLFFDVKSKEVNLSRSDFLKNQSILADNFEHNVEAIINLAERNGASVLLMTSVSNISDLPPETFFMPNTEATGLFVLGKKAEKEGNYEKANQYLTRAKDLTLMGQRAPSEFNDRLRALARKHSESVRLIDTEKLLLAEKVKIGCNYFGDETYCDAMHPNKILKQKMAQWIAKELLQMERTKVANGTTPPGTP